MIIKVNGKQVEIKNSKNISEFVVEYGLQNKFCAIEKNLKIIPKNEYANTKLEEGDCLEVVSLCPGG